MNPKNFEGIKPLVDVISDNEVIGAGAVDNWKEHINNWQERLSGTWKDKSKEGEPFACTAVLFNEINEQLKS